MTDEGKRFTVVQHVGGVDRELLEGDTLEDVWLAIAGEDGHAGARFTVVEHEGYSETELFEGGSLDDIRRKIGEKTGREDEPAAAR